MPGWAPFRITRSKGVASLKSGARLPNGSGLGRRKPATMASSSRSGQTRWRATRPRSAQPLDSWLWTGCCPGCHWQTFSHFNQPLPVVLDFLAYTGREARFWNWARKQAYWWCSKFWHSLGTSTQTTAYMCHWRRIWPSGSHHWRSSPKVGRLSDPKSWSGCSKDDWLKLAVVSCACLCALWKTFWIFDRVNWNQLWLSKTQPLSA